MFGFVPIPQFIVNQPFVIRYRFQNISKNKFPGGPIELRIKWYGAAEEYVRTNLDELEPGNWSKSSEEKLNVHARGMGIVYYYSSPPAGGKDVKLYFNGREIDVRGEDRTIYGMPTTTIEEVYTLVALWIAAR